MEVSLVNAEGKSAGTKTVLEGWDARPVVAALLQQAVVAERANARRPWAHTKGRGDVRGGGRKPWKQKGTGRARHGSSRSPIWKGGGVTFGPSRERDYGKRMPETMKRVALGMALVTKVRDKELVLVEGLPAHLKTKDFARFLHALGVKGSVLVSPPTETRSALLRAGRNLSRVSVKSPQQITAGDVLTARHVIVTPESWTVLEERIKKSQ